MATWPCFLVLLRFVCEPSNVGSRGAVVFVLPDRVGVDRELSSRCDVGACDHERADARHCQAHLPAS